jgi:hypothetical protein
MRRPRRAVVGGFVVCLSVLTVAVSAGAGGSATSGGPAGGAPGLTGTWRGIPDGGTYYIRRVGRNVWWVGLSGKPNTSTIGETFSNVFNGTIDGSTIKGRWAEVRRDGRPLRNGTVELEVRGAGTLVKTDGNWPATQLHLISGSS